MMQGEALDTTIEFLKGVGPHRAEMLQKELGIFRFNDLLNFFPFRYIDRSKFYTVSEIKNDLPFVQLKGQIMGFREIGQARKKRLVAKFTDGTGTMELIWFKGAKWIKDNLKTGKDYIVFGKPNFFNGTFSIPHPEMEEEEVAQKKINAALQPVYHSSEKLNNRNLNSKGITKLLQAMLPLIKEQLVENLPEEMIQRFKLMHRREAFYTIHFPPSSEALFHARRRLKFEELFFIQLGLVRDKEVRKHKIKGYLLEELGGYFKQFYEEILPFELTGAQKRVLKEIRLDTMTGAQMNRLVQGDVGSGKTIVALMSLLVAIDNGFQGCLMAPTEILATQHYTAIKEMLEPLGLEVAFLSGSIKGVARKKILESLADDSLKLIIGTHALIEDKVQFAKLGMCVIDEQHRFGVAQRSRLWKKSTLPPHVLVMTATPIPRTLAMTLYGDLDISIIDELPPGRKAIKTVHRYDSNRLAVQGFMKEEIAKGRQVYVVYPLIEESETLDYKDLMDGYESISRDFPRPQYQVSVVHGRMKSQDKEMEMQRFVSGKTQIMVATTVIEVGVNVPNASVMVIESAERFGLSQLHQLRGRVGRGSDQSFCIMMSSHKLSAEGKERLATMVRTNDGFEIADVDLKLRGPGDMMGTRQSGVLDLKIADLVKDARVLQVARDTAKEIIAADPSLNKPEHIRIRNFFIKSRMKDSNWSRIS
ncbi:MAG: ATP-dependent DNA helicase RecG [Flavobacteriales bacterium]|jgi:ATP-dependent DNA helicase RecG